jgi:hypothetical protein
MRILIDMKKKKRVYAWQYIDGEKVFRYYWEVMGTARSYIKLSKWAKTEGMSNPTTGKSPTSMAVWFAVWRWAIKNQEIAYTIYNKALSDNGGFINKEQWKEFIDEKAEVCLNERGYKKFRQDYGYV